MDSRGVIHRERAEIGAFLTLTSATRPVVTEAAGQIVTVEEAIHLRDRAVQLPARRDDAFKRAACEEASNRQGKLEL